MAERTANPSAGNPDENESSAGANRRLAHRFPFVALAELVEIKTGERITAQTTQLSSSGCYTGALNPFAEGTEVRVRLSKDGKAFESAGRVLHVHAEFGMGIVFENVEPEQQRVLDAWVASSHS
ncbi:MAG: PilZ domain-containing protein [Candidatus Acidiferrales bacterium]